MVVTTSNFMRLCENNIGDLGANDLTVASELTGFSKENATSRFRNEQYRAKGNFILDSSNTNITVKINANETSLALTADSYTYESLAAHISTVLNSDTSGWAVTYGFDDGTYKFNLTPPQNATLVLSNQTNAIWSTIGFIGSTDKTSTSFAADQQRNHSLEYVQWDLSWAAEITAFFVIGTLDEKFSISSTATILLKANNINDNWDNPPLQIDLSPYRNDSGIHVFIDSLLTDTRFRFWRYHIEDLDNPLGPEQTVKISNVYLGDYINLENRNIQNNFRKVVIDPSIRTESEAGSLYWDNKTKYTQLTSVGFGFIDKDDRQKLEKLYNRIGTSTPIYVSLDPNTQISNELSDLTIYCVYDSAPTMSHVVYDKFNYSLSFREVI